MSAFIATEADTAADVAAAVDAAAPLVCTPTAQDASGANATSLLCPRCDTLILCPGIGRWAAAPAARLPKTAVPDGGWATADEAMEELDEFWAVDEMYGFANIAFSRTVGRHRYLCCPDCEFGPLGYHELQGRSAAELEAAAAAAAVRKEDGDGEAPPPIADNPDSLAAATVPFYLAAARVAAASDQRPPKPTRTMDSAAAAAAGINLAFEPRQGRQEQRQPEPEQTAAPLEEALSTEDPALGETIALTFAAPRIGLYLEDRPAPAPALSAGWPGAHETAIGRFNSVGDDGPGEIHVAGEAEASGALVPGDVVLSVHGVDVRGFGAENMVRLVMAAPRPFEMRFLRRS